MAPSTWGQFFIYQGFNAARRLDAHLQRRRQCRRVRRDDRRRDATARAPIATASELRPVTTQDRSRCPIAQPTARWRTRTLHDLRARITARSSREGDGKWIADRADEKPVAALEQSCLRTKATDYASFLKVAELQGQLVERHAVRRRQGRDRLPASAVHARARRPVRLHQAGRRQRSRRPTGRACTRSTSLPHVVNPANGWVKNTNNWPWTAAGADSPKAADFPRYMDQVGREPARPHMRMLLLNARRDFTPADADRGGVRSLSAGLRATRSAAARGLGRAAGSRSAEGELAGPDRAAARLGLPLGARLGADHAGGVLGRGAVGQCRRSRPRTRT